MSEPLIPAVLSIDPTKGAARLDVKPATDHKVRWLCPPSTSKILQVLQYPDHALLVGLSAGVAEFGVRVEPSDDPDSWCTVTVAGGVPTPPPAPPGPSVWLTGLKKAWAGIKSVATSSDVRSLVYIGAALFAMQYQGCHQPAPSPAPPVITPPSPTPTPEPPVVAPPAPTPTPVVVDVVPPATQQAIQAAYEAETDPNKSAATRTLADLMANIVAKAKASGAVKTHKDFDAAVHAATNLAIGEKAIPKVRAAFGAYIASILPTDAAGPVDDAYWAKAEKAYSTGAAALNGVKR